MAETRILCVDDELSVLAALSRQLRRHFDVTIAGSGAEALDLIQQSSEPYAVIVSDMKMPGMNGAEFLRRTRELSPSSVRVVLTGQADPDAAASAVNDGAISRFLTKPCSGEVLVTTLQDCAHQYERQLVEREVLEQTVAGAVSALGQVVALIAPQLFAHLARVRRIVHDVVVGTDPPDGWAIEMAVQLSQLGAASLPSDVLERWLKGATLRDEDRQLVERIPEVSLSIVEQIPRLEVVQQILRGLAPSIAKGPVHPGTIIVRLAFELEALERCGLTPREALDRLSLRATTSEQHVLDAMRHRPAATVVTTSVFDLEPGQVLADDVVGRDGMLLVGRGAPVTPALAARLRAFLGRDVISEHIRVELLV